MACLRASYRFFNRALVASAVWFFLEMASKVFSNKVMALELSVGNEPKTRRTDACSCAAVAVSAVGAGGDGYDAGAKGKGSEGRGRAGAKGEKGEGPAENGEPLGKKPERRRRRQRRRGKRKLSDAFETRTLFHWANPHAVSGSGLSQKNVREATLPSSAPDAKQPVLAAWVALRASKSVRMSLQLNQRNEEAFFRLLLP